MREEHSLIIPDNYVKKLRTGGKALSKEKRRASRRSWYFGALVTNIWENLPKDVHEEVHLLEFYAECSQWINYDLPFPVVSNTGETIRRWCDVYKFYKHYPNVDVWKDVLSFDHFDKARSLGTDPRTAITSSEALAFAVENNWTADEMKDMLESKKAEDPAILENRKRFANWLGTIPDVLLGLNENRELAEYHLKNFEMAVEADRKKDNESTRDNSRPSINSPSKI